MENRRRRFNVYASSPGFPESGPFWLRTPAESLVESGLDRAQSVGRRIQRLRVSAGLTISALAAALDVKSRRLELAEAGRRTLPISALLTLCRLFSHPLREIVGESARPPYFSVLRSADIPRQAPLRRRDARGAHVASDTTVFHPLAVGFPDRRMLPVFIEIRGGSNEHAQMHEHHGEEFIYVYEGSLNLTIQVRGLRRPPCCAAATRAISIPACRTPSRPATGTILTATRWHRPSQSSGRRSGKTICSRRTLPQPDPFRIHGSRSRPAAIEPQVPPRSPPPITFAPTTAASLLLAISLLLLTFSF